MTDLSKHRAPRIHPTVGRVVLFHLGNPTEGPYPGWAITPDGSNTYAATVAYVHSPHMVNLSACDANGIQMGFTSVPLVQEEDERPRSSSSSRAGNWCEWMPYQKGQAAKAEQLERQIAERAPTLNEPYKPEPETAHGERVKRIEDHLRMERDAHADRGAEGMGAHPAIAASQQLDNDGSPLKPGEMGIVTGDGSGQALPTIPQD